MELLLLRLLLTTTMMSPLRQRDLLRLPLACWLEAGGCAEMTTTVRRGSRQERNGWLGWSVELMDGQVIMLNHH